MALRPYQSEAVRAAFDRFEAGDRAVLLELATGTGKTRILTEIVRLSLLNGGRALVTAPLLELAGDRLTILFAVDVAHAHALAEVLNRYRPDVARALDGTMNAEQRAAILSDFAAGRFQVLANVAILTEGYDNPAVSCVAMARPTKSRALYVQCVGRGTRLAPGKESCLVLDFSGTAGRHRLIGPADVLAGRDLDDDVRAELAALLTRGESDVETALDAAEEAANAARAQAAITAVARYRAEVIDLFVGELPDAPRAPWIRDVASEAQRAALTAAGLEDLPPELSKGEASRWLDALSSRRRAGLATFKQVRLLRRYDIDARRMQWTEANEAIDRIASGRWRKRGAA